MKFKIRRLLDMIIKSVGLVDRPAIEESFVEAKRFDELKNNLPAAASASAGRHLDPEKEEGARKKKLNPNGGDKMDKKAIEALLAPLSKALEDLTAKVETFEKRFEGVEESKSDLAGIRETDLGPVVPPDPCRGPPGPR